RSLRTSQHRLKGPERQRDGVFAGRTGDADEVARVRRVEGSAGTEVEGFFPIDERDFIVAGDAEASAWRAVMEEDAHGANLVLAVGRRLSRIVRRQRDVRKERLPLVSAGSVLVNQLVAEFICAEARGEPGVDLDRAGVLAGHVTEERE